MSRRLIQLTLAAVLMITSQPVQAGTAARTGPRPKLQISDILDSSTTISYDGRYIVYASYGRTEGLSKSRGLFGSATSLKLYDRRLQIATDLPGVVPSSSARPTWSPGGRYLAYYATSQDRFTVHVYDIEKKVLAARSTTEACAGACENAPQWASESSVGFIAEQFISGGKSASGSALDRLDRELSGEISTATGLTVLQSPAYFSKETIPAPDPAVDSGRVKYRPTTRSIILLDVARDREKLLAQGEDFVNLFLRPGREQVVSLIKSDYYSFQLGVNNFASSGDASDRAVRVGPTLAMFRPHGQLSASGELFAYAESDYADTKPKVAGDIYVVDLASGRRLNLTSSLPSYNNATLGSENVGQWNRIGKFGLQLGPAWVEGDRALLTLRPRATGDVLFPVQFELWRVPLSGDPVRLSARDLSIVQIPISTSDRRMAVDEGGNFPALLQSLVDRRLHYGVLDSSSGHEISRLKDLGVRPTGSGLGAVEATARMGNLMIAPTGSILASIETAQSPPRLYAGSGRLLSKLTLVNDRIPASKINAQTIVWKRDDGTPVMATLLSKGSISKPAPTIAYVYFTFADNARLAAQGVDGNGDYKHLLNAGYSVLVLDIPQPFRAGCDEMRSDVNAGVRAALATGVVDPERVGLYGYSYGGFISMCAATRSSLFRAVASGGGGGDMTSLCLSAVGCSRNFMVANKYPWEAPEIFVRDSPVYHLDTITAPVLLFYGKDDGLARRNQYVELYGGLLTLGKPVQLVAYDGRDHGTVFTHPDLYPRLIGFFDHYLRDPITTGASVHERR